MAIYFHYANLWRFFLLNFQQEYLENNPHVCTDISLHLMVITKGIINFNEILKLNKPKNQKHFVTFLIVCRQLPYGILKLLNCCMRRKQVVAILIVIADGSHSIKTLSVLQG